VAGINVAGRDSIGHRAAWPTPSTVLVGTTSTTFLVLVWEDAAIAKDAARAAPSHPSLIGWMQIWHENLKICCLIPEICCLILDICQRYLRIPTPNLEKWNPNPQMRTRRPQLTGAGGQGSGHDSSTTLPNPRPRHSNTHANEPRRRVSGANPVLCGLRGSSRYRIGRKIIEMNRAKA
jgi:hypothetical protein